MVRTRGGQRFRLRVQTGTPARDGAGTFRAAACHSPAQGSEASPAFPPVTTMMQSPASANIPKESQGDEPLSRRYHTRVGPAPPPPPPPLSPSPVYPRPPLRAPPSKRAWTSSLVESLRSRPEPLQPPAA